MLSLSRFTLVKRRHHCRSCGKVLCAACCSEKHNLIYLEVSTSESYQNLITGSYQDKEGRVCTPCKNILTRLDQAEAQAPVTGEGGAVGGAGEKLCL